MASTNPILALYSTVQTNLVGSTITTGYIPYVSTAGRQNYSNTLSTLTVSTLNGSNVTFPIVNTSTINASTMNTPTVNTTTVNTTNVNATSLSASNSITTSSMNTTSLSASNSITTNTFRLNSSMLDSDGNSLGYTTYSNNLNGSTTTGYIVRFPNRIIMQQGVTTVGSGTFNWCTYPVPFVTPFWRPQLSAGNITSFSGSYDNNTGFAFDSNGGSGTKYNITWIYWGVY